MTLPPNLQAVRDRADKATAGPWGIWDAWGPTTGAAELMATRRIGPVSHSVYALCGDPHGLSRDFYGRADDLQFVAQSRTDVPALLDLIETLAGAIEILTAFEIRLDRACYYCGRSVGHEQDCDIVIARAALDKYRNYG